ncbi:MAG: hypothetical protein ACM3JD_14080, partial [Rudaea sp.]
GPAGDTEFAVRFLSLVAGVLLVAVTARIARSLFGPRVAVIAALLSALSAFELYYSQETRMYIWVALFSALSFSALTSLMRRIDRGSLSAHAAVDLLIYLLSTIAALYTHYFAPAVLLAQNFAVLVWLIFKWRDKRSRGGPLLFRSIAAWVGTQAVVVMVFLPWFFYAGNQLSSWPAISEPLSPIDLAVRVLAAFTVGIDLPLGGQWLPVALFGLLFLLGLFFPLFYRRSPNSALSSSPGIAGPFSILVLWSIVPLAFMYVVSLQRPAYNPKFLLLSTPAFVMLTASGVEVLARALRRLPSPASPAHAVGALVLLAAAGLSASGIYTDSRLQRDDYRGVVGYINAYAQEGDSVVVDAPGQIDVVRYYYRGAAPLVTLPVGRPLNRAATEGVLDDLLHSRREVYAIYWATEQADPDHYVERVLATNRFQASDEWHGSIRLAQYGAASSEVTTLTDRAVHFGDELVLASVQRIGAGPVRPGRVLGLDFSWVVLNQPAGNYKVFVHLLDSGGGIVSQRDSEPSAGFRPTSSWLEGETIADRLGILIRPGTPPGNYTLVMGVYRPESGTRLPVSGGGDHIELGQVTVAP